jgi:hypothetical protein
MTATPDGCRYLASERVDAEEAVDRISELLALAKRNGDAVRTRVCPRVPAHHGRRARARRTYPLDRARLGRGS